MIDSVGRRHLFITMAIGMCIVLVCEAIAMAIDNKSSGIAAVFFVFAFEAYFTWGESHSLISTKPQLCMWTHRITTHFTG
jgi:hypothetical protein